MSAQEKSRFWAAASSSEGEQGSDSDTLSDVAPAAKTVDRKFAQTYESDSESEDEVRVVKSQKDRKWDSMQEVRSQVQQTVRESSAPYTTLVCIFFSVLHCIGHRAHPQRAQEQRLAPDTRRVRGRQQARGEVQDADHAERAAQLLR
jgi:hypothetical protein